MRAKNHPTLVIKLLGQMNFEFTIKWTDSVHSTRPQPSVNNLGPEPHCKPLSAAELVRLIRLIRMVTRCVVNGGRIWLNLNRTLYTVNLQLTWTSYSPQNYRK